MNDKLLSHIGYDKEKRPFWIVNDVECQREIIEFGQNLNLEFDLNKRYCIGWHDLESGENHICQWHQVLDKKYDQCQKCQAKTGFNPAFYNADSVSEVQQKRNSEPHFLYLAYFANNFTKVGISYAGRGLARLLEQGAKAAIVLETFNSAMVARKYEAQIGKMNNFVENVTASKKIELLSAEYNAEDAQLSLTKARQQIERALETDFENAQFHDFFDQYFSPDFDKSELKYVIDVSNQAKITGKIVGLYGYILICQYQDSVVALPLKKFTGYHFHRSSQIGELELPTQQYSLF